MAAPEPNTWAGLATINPEFAELLPTLPPPPPKEPSILELRQIIAHQNVQNATIDPDVVEHDIKIPGRDGYPIPARVYGPKSPPAAGSPLIVLYHGGGFCVGGLGDEEQNCRNFAKRFGAIAVNVDYRLAPENPYPIPVNDAWDSFKWIAGHASELKANPSKGFIVGGTSAGGNLSAAISLLARDEKLSPPLTGVCLMIASTISYQVLPAKYKHLHGSFEQNKNAPILSEETMKQFVDAYKADQNDWHFNSFNHPDGHSNLPPHFFQICGMDPLRDDALIHEKVLREEYGVKTKVVLYPGLPHMFFAFFSQLKASKKYVEDTSDGIRWLLSLK